jgi:membrane protein DedA with SNARE-associated domain
VHPSLPFAELLSLANFGERWQYLTLGVSSILTEELAPLLGGFAAEQGHLRLPWVILSCAVGVFVLSAGLYFVGRWRAAWVRLKLRKSPPIVKRMLNAMRWNPWRTTLLARVAFGGRIALPLACGAARVPAWIFLTGSAVASLVWAAALAGLGWAFGEGAVLLLGEVRKYEGWVVLVLALLGGGAYLWLRKRTRGPSASGDDER